MSELVLLSGRLTGCSLIAEGSGAARVYRGTLDGEIDVAVKVIPRPRNEKEREKARKYFAHEAELASQVHNANVRTAMVSVELESAPELGALAPNGAFVQVYRWEERSLRADLDRSALRPENVVELAHALSSALTAVHGAEREVLHRDIKPENLLVSGETYERTVLTDFGIATQSGTDASTSMLRGTFRYMPPEQFRFEGKERESRQSDLYSAALVLWECLTGEVLLYDEELDAFDLYRLRRSGLDDAMLSVDGIEAEALSLAFQGFLSPDPDARPASVSELVEMFVDALIDDGLLESSVPNTGVAIPWPHDDKRDRGGCLWVFAPDDAGDQLKQLAPAATWQFARSKGAWFTRSDVAIALDSKPPSVFVNPVRKKDSVVRRPDAAFMMPVMPNAKLAAIVGASPLPRTELTKKLWAYIKRHGLQDKKNRRMINADDKLALLFGGKRQVSMFDMTKLVSKNLL